MKSSLIFLHKKLHGVRFVDLLQNQIEAFVIGLVSWIPTILGMTIRNFVYRALGMKAKGFCWIQPGVMFVNIHRLKVGRNFACNSGTYINALGNIAMGNDVLIGSNVTISAGKHDIEGRGRSVFSRPAVPSSIYFGNDIWLGAGVVILPGLHLGDGTVVGANSVVTKDTENYSVMAGVPARLIRFRD